MTLLQKFDAAGPWSDWETSQAKLHPQCAPKVGSVDLFDFLGMHASDREKLRQGSEDALHALTTAALTYGLGVPAGLLMIGLVLGWVIRGVQKVMNLAHNDPSRRTSGRPRRR